MRDDALRDFLTTHNPWWRAAATGSDPVAWTATDRMLRDRQSHDLGYRANIFSDVATASLTNGLHVLRGPRRVGKSVVLKDLVADLCRRPDLSAWQLIYLPVDTFTTQDLRRAIVLGREMTRAAGNSPRVWIVDEITAIDGWTAEIKSLRDNTSLGDDTVILTGSSATGAAEAVRDLGAGRTGQARDPFRLLLPMSFRSFLTATEPDLPTPDPIAPWELQTRHAADALAVLEVFTGDLDLAWQRYLESGGFPRAVFEHNRHGAVSSTFLHELASWLTADVDPAQPQESVTLFLADVQARTAAPLNVRALASQLGVSRTHVTTRLNRLVSAFAGIWCPQVDDHGRRVTGAQSKLYLVDPLLSWLGHHLRPGLARPDYTQLTEAAVGITLARVVEHHSSGRWLAGDVIGYARPSGSEIDFAPMPIAGPTTTEQTPPVEVKWISSGWRPSARAIERKYGGGLIATKSVSDHTHPAWALPAPALSLLLA